MEVQAAGIVIVIAVGKTAMTMIDQYLESDIGPSLSAAGEDSKRTILIGVNDADGKIMINGPERFQGTFSFDPASPDQLTGFLWGVLDSFLKDASRLVSSDSVLMTDFHLDIVIAGAAHDPSGDKTNNTFFLDHFLKIAVTVEELVHSRYEALVSFKGAPENAAFIIMPVLLSENLFAESNRKEILSMIGSTYQWQEDISAFLTHRRCIPRFYVFDGVARNGIISFKDQTMMLTHLLSLLTDSGIRRSRQLKDLLGFSAYPEDFLSIMNITAAVFPVKQLSDYCGGVSLLGVFDALLDNPEDINDAELQAVFQETEQLLNPVTLERLFTDAGSGFDLVATLSQTTPTFHSYRQFIKKNDRSFWENTLPESEEEKLLETTGVSRLRLQETYLPEITWRDAPEEMQDFFNDDWEQYPANELTKSTKTRAAERFDMYHETINACGLTLQEKIRLNLQSDVDKSLSISSGEGRIGATLDYLKNDLLPRVKQHKEQWEANKGFLSLPDMPDMSKFGSNARIFRQNIWNRAAYKVLLFWMPVLLFMFFLSFYHLMPVLASFIQRDAMDMSLSVRLLKPPLRVPVSIILSILLVGIPMLIYNYLVGVRLRRFSRSEYPFKVLLAKKESLMSQGNYTARTMAGLQRSIEKLTRKIAKFMKNRGVLARNIAEAQREQRIYWQARLKLITYVWIKRILFMAQDIIEDEIERLHKLRTTLGKHQTEVVGSLRNAGCTVENMEKCTMIQPSTPFIKILIDNEQLSGFADTQCAIQKGGSFLNHFIEQFGLLSQWRNHSLLHDLKLLYPMAVSVYPALSKGMFTLNDHSGRIRVQLEEFFATLDDRHSGGEQFRFFASIEKNKTIYDTGYHVFCHPSATQVVRDAMLAQALRTECLANTASNRNRVTVIRILKDLHLDTLINYFGYRLKASSTPEKMTPVEDIWDKFRKSSPMEVRDA